MPILELFDETLDINSTENYELSVQVNTSDLSFCILDTLRNKFVLLRSYEPEGSKDFDTVGLGEIISKDDFLSKHYKKVSLVTPSEKSTLVPAALFDESKRDEYFKYNQINSIDYTVLTNHITDPDIFLLFCLPNEALDLLKIKFPGSIPLHQLKSLFYHIKLHRRTLGSNYVHIHFEKEYINLIIFDQNALKFCNTFHYKDLSDIQYFVLYVFKKMNINQEEVVFLSGMTKYNGGIVKDFSKYIGNIKFAEPTGNFTFSYVFNDVELHRFLNLFNAVNCE
jgi:hypothetical protein